jgi:hypothetical protein
MLNWIAAVLFEGRTMKARHMRQREGGACLDYLTRTTISLVIIRSAELLGRRPSLRHMYFKRGRDLRRRHLIRSFLGARLRRTLSYKGDPATRIKKLTQVLRRLDDYARLLFCRRLTRVFPKIVSPTSLREPHPANAPIAAPAPCDSS